MTGSEVAILTHNEKHYGHVQCRRRKAYQIAGPRTLKLQSHPQFYINMINVHFAQDQLLKLNESNILPIIKRHPIIPDATGAGSRCNQIII